MEERELLEREQLVAAFGSLLGKWITIGVFVGAILGTILWKWYAIPIAIAAGLIISRFYGMVFIDPILKKRLQNRK